MLTANRALSLTSEADLSNALELNVSKILNPAYKDLMFLDK